MNKLRLTWWDKFCLWFANLLCRDKIVVVALLLLLAFGACAIVDATIWR